MLAAEPVLDRGSGFEAGHQSVGGAVVKAAWLCGAGNRASAMRLFCEK